MIIVLVLLGALCFGAAALVGVFMYQAWDDFGAVGKTFIVLIGAPLAILFCLIPIGFAADEMSPDLTTLKKVEWACNSSHQETRLIWVGKVLVPMNVDVCDQYGRIGK